ncbi:MAG: hypothetical protein V4548_01500 [Bacteroidota bacterium]
MITFEEIDPFKKDCKGLLKKYKTLKDDIEVVQQILAILPAARPPFSNRIDNLAIQNCVVKVKKIACKSLKGNGVNSGLRLVYAYFKDNNKIVFIEIYHKNDKENEDRDRIISYFK